MARLLALIAELNALPLEAIHEPTGWEVWRLSVAVMHAYECAVRGEIRARTAGQLIVNG